LSRRYNNRRIIKSFQTIAPGKLLPGMILTFNYSEVGVTDPRPILSYLYTNRKNKIIEGINMNYLSMSKIDKYFDVIDFKKGITGKENLISLKEAYFRIEISNPKHRSAMTTERFYNTVVKADKYFQQAYRSYKLSKLSSLKVINIQDKYIHIPGGSALD